LRWIIIVSKKEVRMSESQAASTFTISQCASLACVLEATAHKPGNVHRGADFEDLTYLDFITAAIAISPAIAAAAAGKGLGESVLAGVTATRAAVATNANLGMLLLLTPLAMVSRSQPLAAGVADVLTTLTPADARGVYEAIRLANPGGLGRVADADVADEPPADLLHVMRLAEDRDLVARQYANNFSDVLDTIVPWLAAGVAAGWPLADVIVHAHMQTLARYPDSLIARKCGQQLADETAARAGRVLAEGEPGHAAYHEAVSDFDFWLRSDGHRRNPGTTADLISAGLFAALRDGIIKTPWRFYA
jgi:triphosphoribosyl-dephospho-CoA synthase